MPFEIRFCLETFHSLFYEGAHVVVIKMSLISFLYKNKKYYHTYSTPPDDQSILLLWSKQWMLWHLIYAGVSPKPLLPKRQLAIFINVECKNKFQFEPTNKLVPISRWNVGEKIGGKLRW